MPSRASSLKTKQVFLEPERHKKKKKKKGKRKAGPNPSVGSQKCEWYCDLPIATSPLLQKGLGKGWDKTKNYEQKEGEVTPYLFVCLISLLVVEIFVTASVQKHDITLFE